MLTYQFNTFSIKFSDKGDLEFPSTVSLIVRLGPEELFGIKEGLIRAVFAGYNKITDIILDFNKGRQGAANILKPDEFTGSYQIKEYVDPDNSFVHEEYNVNLERNILSIGFNCNDKDSLAGFLYLAKHLIPASLSLELCEPVYVEEVSGTCNGRDFQLRLKEYSNFMTVIRPGDIQNMINCAFKNLEVIRCCYNPRLKAALHYFHVARRLIVVGDNIWEFVGEIILNYHKILEALFSNSRDQIREQLKLLGYNENKIESIFIPVTLLRNHFDIAHSKFSYPQRIDTPNISKYIVLLEDTFRELIKRIIDKCDRQEYNLLPHEGMEGYKTTDQGDWDKINENIKKVFFGNQK